MITGVHENPWRYILQLVDSHCHLLLIGNGDRDLDEILCNARDHDVSHMLCVSVDLESYGPMRQKTASCANVFCSVGVHPNTTGNLEDPSIQRLVALAADPAVIAVGETGLDYFRSRGALSSQKARFRNHVRAARETGKPLIVHTRDAASDVIALLREERAEEVGGVMHCFVDDWETASAALDLGFYISFSGIVTFDSAAALQDVATRVPEDRILIETDAPWLAPTPKRGRENEPAFVRYTAEFLAARRETTLEDFAAATTRNFFALFTHARVS